VVLTAAKLADVKKAFMEEEGESSGPDGAPLVAKGMLVEATVK
jgi:hypothetical protein